MKTFERLTKRTAIAGCFVISVVIVGSVSGFKPAGPGAMMNVTVTAAGQDGPLQILALRPPDFAFSDSISMHVINTSNKDTQDYWIKPLIRARDRSAPMWDYTNAHAAMTPEAGIIPAHGETWTRNMTTLTPGIIRMAAKDLRSTCLEITPVVLEAHFADGTNWRLRDDGHALERVQGLDGGPACPGSVVAEKDWEQLNATDGDSIRRDPEHSLFRSVDANGVQSFSFSCSIHRRDDSHVALFCGR
jgi:hypothetical protein